MLTCVQKDTEFIEMHEEIYPCACRDLFTWINTFIKKNEDVFGCAWRDVFSYIKTFTYKDEDIYR